MMTVTILCGGTATRLYPTTKTIPKSLIKVTDKPFIYHQLSLLKQQGVTDVVFCVGKFGDMIEDYVGDGHKWDLKIQYSYDGDTLLGTGGAIKKALKILPYTFMVLYGDSYLDVNLKPIIEKFECEKKPALMTVYHNKNKWDKSNILFKDGRILKYDKKNQTDEMKYIDYGISILKKEVFDGWNGVFDISDVFIKVIKNGEMSGFEVNKRFYEIGSVRGIKEFEKYLKNREVRQKSDNSKIHQIPSV